MINSINVSQLQTRDIGHVDVFIAFCGFEKRCLSVIKNLQLSKINKALIFMNTESCTESRENLVCFKNTLETKMDLISIDLFNPIDVADNMLGSIRRLCNGIDKPHLFVDITSFTHEALLVFLAMSQLYFQNAVIEYAYSNASIYASELNDTDEKWLSRGIREVRSILGYAGDIKPSQETVLIMMVGYECERAWQLIDSLSPEELIITYNDASGSTDQTNGDANLVHASLLKDLAAFYQNPKQFIVPSNNPFETARKLEEIVSSIPPSKNIIIAPMNNKLATFGAGLVALKRPDIQLCYAPAIYYNTSCYSIEGDTCYLFSLENRNHE